MSRHRAPRTSRLRLRYGRMAAASTAFTVSAIAVLGGLGVIPVDRHRTAVAEVTNQIRSAASTTARAIGGQPSGTAPASDARGSSSTSGPLSAAEPLAASARKLDPTLPTQSGHGRRVVFSKSRQRVWLVKAHGTVVRTYLVSGSLTDNLGPGTYHVYSRARWAVGVDDSGTMQYFVRFTRGSHAAIGFHSVPKLHGKLEETRAELGSPQSHGCIRQWLPDARRLWHFAPVGTKVVVTA